MPGFTLRFIGSGPPPNLGRLAAAFKNPSPAGKAAAEWIAGQTMRTFDTGGHGGEWQPLSRLTLFIRYHRANMPRKSDKPMSDTGRLKGSFTWACSDDGKQVMVGTNVEYAPAMQEGGPSPESSVTIGKFSRRRPGSKIGYVMGRKRYTGGGPVTVRAYVMTIHAGHNVPARPFFPPAGVSGLRDWNYLDPLRQIYALKFGEAMG